MSEASHYSHSQIVKADPGALAMQSARMIEAMRIMNAPIAASLARRW
jgi:hypothetical protein